MTPSPLGPCRKEVLGVLPPKGDIPSLNFLRGALWAPLGPPGPGALAPATPLSRWACAWPRTNSQATNMMARDYNNLQHRWRHQLKIEDTIHDAWPVSANSEGCYDPWLSN